MDTYKGESPSKKVARYSHWRDVRRWMGADAFVHGHFLFLASREGGDASVLRAMGVPDSRMVAVERDVSAAQIFSARFPGITLCVGDVADVAESKTMRDWGISAAFLDFCAPLNRETFETVRRVCNTLQLNTTLSVGLLRGRESDSAAIQPLSGMSRQSRRLWQSMQRANMKRYARTHGTELRDVTNGKSTSGRRLVGAAPRTGAIDESRSSAIHQALIVNPENRLVELARVINYQSVTDGSRGVPMSISMFLRRRGFDEFADGFDAIKIPVFDDDSMRKMVIEGRIFLSDEWDASLIPALLNIPAGTAAAWRAHSTRGTYGAE